jgi:hypothetical protein
MPRKGSLSFAVRAGLVALGLLGGAVDRARSDLIYWTDSGIVHGDIRRANFDGSGQQILVTTIDEPSGLALDPTGGKMYWADYEYDIRRANLDGTGEQVLVTRIAPNGLALDVASGKMYWTDLYHGARTIQSANLDGTDQQILVSGLRNPAGIALDTARGKMYWTDPDAGIIMRANLDGTGQQTLLTGLYFPYKIALDLAGGKMYWAGGLGILRANLDGTGLEMITGPGLPSPGGLALDVAHDTMFWSGDVSEELGNPMGDIRRTNLDGTALQILVTGLYGPGNIALQFGAAPIPEPSALLLLGIGIAGVIGWAWRRNWRI